MTNISRKYALRLIRDGRATIDGATYEPDSRTGVRDMVIVIRHDLQSVDHYEYTEADKAAVDEAERQYA